MAGSRRTPGEGGAYEYPTKAGPRWFYKCAVTDAATGETKTLVRRGFKNKTTALSAMKEVLGQSAKGAYFEPSGMTVGEWLDQWLRATRLTPNTEASYTSLTEWYIKPGLGAVQLGKLTSSRIDEWMRDLERGSGLKGHPLKPSTIRLAFTVLSRILTSAVEHEPPLISVNPCRKAHPPRRARGAASVPKAWSEEQAAAFIRWAREKDAEWADLWELALMSGGRRNELLTLCWQDEEEDGITILHGKGEKVRHIPLDKGTRAMLRRRKVTRGAVNLALVKPGALIFTRRDGSPVPLIRATAAFRSAVRRARRDLGEDALPAITLHGTRHTMATIWLRAGVPVQVVAQRLGHASPVITMGIYAHVLKHEQQGHVDRVAERMTGQPPAATSITEPDSDASEGRIP